MYNNGYGKSQAKPDVSITTTNIGQDAFLVRYSTDGVAIWSARIGGTGSEVSWAVTTDLDGNVIVGGATGSATSLLLYNSDGSAALNSVVSNSGSTDAFIIKYTRSGVVLWAARMSGGGIDVTYGLSTDSSGNIFVALQGTGTVTFVSYNSDGTSFSPTLSLLNPDGDAILVKYNSSGFVQWNALTRAGGAVEFGYGVVADSSGSAYLVGQASGGTTVTTTVFNADGSTAGTIPSAGAAEAFIIKYSASGVVQWITRVSSAAADFARYVVIDSSDNIYVAVSTAATTAQTITAYNSDGTTFATTFAGLGGGDTVVVKYDSSGFVQWMVNIGNATTVESPWSMTIDSSSNVYVAQNWGGGPNGDIQIRKLNPTNGAIVWTLRIGSDGGDNAYGLTTDSSGNLYVGCTNSNISPANMRFYNLAGTLILTVTNPGGNFNTGFLVKYDSSGTLIWVRRIGNAANATMYGLTTGNNDELYQVGTGSGGSLRAYGQQMSLFSSIGNSGGTDGFVVKYNTNGKAQWVARIASTGDDIVYGTATDSFGNMYVTGQTGNGVTTTFFNADTTAFATTLVSVGNDAFIAKYSTDGVVQWVASITSTGTDIGYAAATDSSGNLYITGQGGSATVTANNSDGTSFTPNLTNGGLGDAFVVKYDSSGFVQWNARIESTQADIGFGIATDSSGNLYVTGQTGTGVTTRFRNFDDTTFGSLTTLGGTDTFIAKYNTSGTVQWIARIGSTGTDAGRSVAVDPSGNVYITGPGGNATVTAYEGGDGTGASFGNVVNAGNGDVFIVKYDTNGVGQWITRIASTAQDVGTGITTDAFGNVYVTGNAGAAVTTAFSVGNIAFPLTLASSGLGDAFIVKYNSAGVVQWVTRIASNVADSAFGIKADRSGNVYVVGQFGPSSNTHTIFNSDGTVYAEPFESCAVVKYDTNGMVEWVIALRGTTTGVNVRSVDVDIFRNIYIGGNSNTGDEVRIYSVDLTPYLILQSQRGTQEGYIIKYNSEAIPQWASVVSTAGADLLYEVKADSTGNIYATGQYGTGTMFLYNGDGTLFTPTLAISGTLDSILLKYNSSGTIQWRSRITGGGSEQAIALATDSSGNSYVTGQGGAGTTTIFIDSDDVTRLTNLATTAGLQDAFVVKYDTSGLGQWRFRISSTAVDTGIGIAVDSSGNVYIVGTAGAATFFNSNDVSSGVSITDTGAGDAFVAKYDSSGNFVWVAKIGSTSADLGYGIAVDSSGNVYVTGVQGGGTLTITNSAGNGTFATTYTTIGGQDIFVVKFNTNGVAQWVTRIGGTASNDIGRSIALDSSDNVFVVGSFSGNVNIYQQNGTTVWSTINSADGGGGSIDAFIIKYDTNLVPQWVGRISSASNTFDTAFAVTTDTAGNAYVVGFGVNSRISIYNGGVGGAGTTLFGTYIFSRGNTVGGQYTYLAKYNSLGAVQWITGFQGGNGNDNPRGVATDSSGNILMSGFFTESVLLPESA